MGSYEIGYNDGYRQVWWGHPPEFPAKGVADQQEYERGNQDGAVLGQKDRDRGYSYYYGKR